MIKNPLSNITIVFLLGLLHANILLSDDIQQQAPKLNEYADLGKKYNFTPVDTKQSKTKLQEDGKCLSLTKEEVRKTALQLIPKEKFKTNIINDTLIEKLLLINTPEQRSFFLNTVFNGHISTAFGEAQALLTLSNPTTDTAVIGDRQKAIDLLDKNKPFAQALNKELDEIGDAETKSLLPFQSEKNILKEGETLPAPALLFRLLSKGAKTNPLALDTTIAYNLCEPIITFAIFTWVTVPLIKHSYNKLDDNLDIQFLRDANALTSTGVILAIKATRTTTRTVNTIRSIKNLSRPGDLLATTQKHINALNKLSTLVSQDEKLLKHLPSLQPLADFNNAEKHSNDFNSLVAILNSSNFEGQDSFFSRKGPTIAAYNLLKEVKDELVPIFAAAGELDMYIALAKLYNADDTKQARYCMPQCIENSTTPILDAHNFWNPYVNVDNAVTNSLTFDHSTPNAIITGPNTGGKSTTMKALMLNALMAQSFGIAPSEKLTLTPFSKMGCLMNTSDNIAQATSLFRAEVINANDILSMAQGLKHNEFGLFSMDEIFTGTSPDVGEDATRRFATKLGSYKNAISIIATHYKDIANLKKNPNSRYTNLQMVIDRNEDGSLKRTYKVAKGESTINIANEIIKEEGLDI